MSDMLGPRTIYYVAADGSRHPITITIELGEPEIIDLGGDKMVTNHIADITLVSDWFDRTMRFRGADDLQAIY